MSREKRSSENSISVLRLRVQIFVLTCHGINTKTLSYISKKRSIVSQLAGSYDPIPRTFISARLSVVSTALIGGGYGNTCPECQTKLSERLMAVLAISHPQLYWLQYKKGRKR